MPKILRVCKECGKEFFVWPHIIELGKGHFCSGSCRKIRAGDKLKGRRGANHIVHLETHCEIIIKNKKGVIYHVLFDREDLEIVEQHTWAVGQIGYAMHNSRVFRGTLHRLIMNTPVGMDTDHINRDKLDNRRKNLRICTTTQNLRNVTLRSGRKYKGVHKTKNDTYQAKIGKFYLGAFPTAEAAAVAYNDAAKIHFGEFANLNVI